uniref:2-haloalkanoic acid dehalogenase, putative n=1 Tax=Colletotrichum fructicola (strain Nara gc5) TaxID=1213859 RepID=L2FYZ8_COLFN
MLYQAGVPEPRQLATDDDVAFIMERFMELEARPGIKECFTLLREAGFTVWAFTAGDAKRLRLDKRDPRAYKTQLESFGGEEAWFAAAHMWDASAAKGCGFKGAWCSIYEKEPCVDLFGEMDVMADELPEMARKIIAASEGKKA